MFERVIFCLNENPTYLIMMYIIIKCWVKSLSCKSQLGRELIFQLFVFDLYHCKPCLISDKILVSQYKPFHALYHANSFLRSNAKPQSLNSYAQTEYFAALWKTCPHFCQSRWHNQELWYPIFQWEMKYSFDIQILLILCC